MKINMTFGTLEVDEIQALMNICQEKMGFEVIASPDYMFYGAIYYKLEEMKDKLTPREKLE